VQKGIGIDIIEINRVKAAVKQFRDKFLNKVFTKRELDYCTKKKALKYPELAARFAAKEAYSKAVGTGIRGIHWGQIEIINDSRGKPLIYINRKLLKRAMVSLSHSLKYATAVVMVG
jgi:holo-[acyl-carrier protein] synthase